MVNNRENNYSKKDLGNLIPLGLEEHDNRFLEDLQFLNEYEEERFFNFHHYELDPIQEDHPDDLLVDMIDYGMPMTDMIMQGITFDPFEVN